MLTYKKYIFFTKSILTGSYRFEDVFQIYPLSIPEMPTIEIQDHFPNVIEFIVDSEEKLELDLPFPEFNELFGNFGIEVVKQDLIFNLLTTCSNHLFFRYQDSNGHWGFVMHSNNPEDYCKEAVNSQWCIPLFQCKGYIPYIFSFTDIEFPQIPMLPVPEYFLQDISLDIKKDIPITFPKILDQFLFHYFRLDEIARIQINNAIFHLKTGIEFYKSKKTLSLISLFTSLETMINLEYIDFKAEKCNECGQLKYSVSRKFKDFLSKYVSSNKEQKGKFNKLYSLRSKIIHTGEVLESEFLFAKVKYETIKSEDIKLIEIIQYCRIAIVRWVLENKKKHITCYTLYAASRFMNLFRFFF